MYNLDIFNDIKYTNKIGDFPWSNAFEKRKIVEIADDIKEA